MEQAGFTLCFAKQDFKFAAAHFTLFPDGRGELLHGHNFRVRLWLRGAALGAGGLLADAAALKQKLRALCRRLDERTLIPAHSDALQITRTETQAPAETPALHIVFGARRYSLPADEVALLPLANTSMELLARYLWNEMAPAAAEHAPAADWMRVAVEESAGQSCAYAAALPATA